MGAISLQKLSHDHDSEQFAILYRNDKRAAHDFGYLQTILRPVSEADVRAFFGESGYPCEEIETMLRVARASFEAAPQSPCLASPASAVNTRET